MRRRSDHYRKAAVLLMAVLLLLTAGCLREGGEEDGANAAVHDARTMGAAGDSMAAGGSALAVPAVGETIAAVIPAPMTASPALMDAALFYTVPGDTFAVQTVRDGWISADTPVGTAWLHAWYLMPEAAAAKTVTPIRVTLKPNAALSVYPGGEAVYTAAELAERTGTGTAVALRRFGDWYGIVMPLNDWIADDMPRRPFMLWAEAAAVERSVALTHGLLSPENGLTFVEAMQLSEAALTVGMEAAEVQRILGRPDAEETSLPLNYTGEPLRLGTDLRYRAAGGLLTATLDENGLLTSWRWRLPAGTPLEQEVPRYSYPDSIRYEAARYDSVPSVEPDWIWRSNGDLAYAYLLGADDDVLLVRGDDGGFSGMHDDSSIYALDRADGRKLWQIDAGFGWADAIVDPDGGEATILTHYDPARKEYVEQLRRVRLDSGETVWSHTLDVQGRLVQAGDVVLHGVETFGETAGTLTARHAKDGRLLWEREIDSPYALMNRGAADRYVLVRIGETLEALDPLTGKQVWHIAGRPLSEELSLFESSFIDASAGRLADGYRWIQLGGERLLLDIGKGKAVARYPIQAGEHVTAVDGGKLLIQRSLDEPRHWEAKQFDVLLYDPAEAQELWSRPADQLPAIESNAAAGSTEERIYVMLNGVPAAMDLRDGTVIWQMNIAASHTGGLPVWVTRPPAVGGTLLMPADNELLAVSASDGELLYRLHNTRFGLPERYEEDLLSMFFLRESDNIIYIGSANGQLSKMRLPERRTP